MNFHSMSNKFLSFFIVLCLSLTAALQADEFPDKPDRLVNDYAGLLNAQDREVLERKLEAYEDSTSTQIAIAILDNIGPYEASDYAIRLGEKWEVGQKGKNNGLLILVVKQTHDVFIATGYGMEADLPDALVKRLTENVIIPRFKQGDFYGGLDEVTNAIMQIMAGVYQEDHRGTASNRSALVMFFVILAVIVLISIISKKGGGGNSGGRGGGWLFPVLMSSGGFSSRGSYSGGFGGFGGGSFGGGGAGGRW